MSFRRKTSVTMLATLLALACAAAPALASRAIAVSPAGAITVSPPITFSAGGGTTTCTVTFTGIFSAQIAKTPGALFGTLTSAPPAVCSGGLVSRAAFLGPIDMTYTSFLGTLPNITGIGVLFRNLAVLFTTLAGSCLYAGNVGGLFSTPGNPVNSNGSTTMTRLSGSALCPPTIALSGVGPYGPAQRFTLV